MKINKKYLALRIITFPIKLIFTIVWFFIMSLIISAKWVIFGSQELYYGKDGKNSLTNLIEQNEKIIKHFEL